ncbi:MAG: EAL domain-containing protein [Holosporaceae bacterium]|jgi:EAL domain-containing protein (putative c-di-GMP-specific phosphodiesterase class I)|nr:EAL domain-containing protein [Holosporaceae bacterium]
MTDKIRLQPLVNLSDNIICGYEALYKKENTDVYPGAARILQSIASSCNYRNNFQLFINMTAKDIVSKNFCRSFLKILEKNHINGSNIVLEVNENTHPDALPSAKCVLSLLRSHGIKIALDDFGTEYSGLAFLKELPVDIVKIDKKFTQETPSSKKSRALLKFCTRLSHEIGCSVVAEGIETMDQLECVRDSGADMGQGFLFAASCKKFVKKNVTQFIDLCEFASSLSDIVPTACCC